MNPPSALHNAMGRERKPFTYTPGGLDLSEIKSERMARRLMRNAMNQGVPEVPTQSIQSPPTPSTPVAVPNYNCLPVQVFPTFSLPANPKTLLRTRSNPTHPRDPVFDRVPSPTHYMPSNVTEQPYEIKELDLSTQPKYSDYYNNSEADVVFPTNTFNINDFSIPASNKFINDTVSKTEVNNFTEAQKEVKVVKKQVKKEKKSEESQDENSNNIDAEATVQLAPKKSAAKTETTVEVVQKVGPDGEIEEIKTTKTKTTINGKTEVTTKTETKKIPAQPESEEEEEIEEEEEEEVVQTSKENTEPQTKTTLVKQTSAASENEEKDDISNKEEKHEVITTKKVVVVEKTTKKEESEEEEEEEEEVEEEEEEQPPIQKVVEKPQPPAQKPAPLKQETKEEEEEAEDEEEDEEEIEAEEPIKEVKPPEEKLKEETQVDKKTVDEVKRKDEEVEADEVEKEEEVEIATEEKVVKSETTKVKQEQEEEEEVEEEEEEEEYEEAEDKEVRTEKESPKLSQKDSEIVSEIVEEKKEEVKVESETLKKEEPPTPKPAQKETQIPIFTENVESVEIKPILPAALDSISKTHTETTEIRSTVNDELLRPVSTQTELHRIENIVTVNRTTKTLDQAYEQITQHGIPTVKTYFAPGKERVSTSPQPAKPYQSSYIPEQKTERRHSLLLERLSTERQLPPTDSYSNTYQTYNNNQNYETTQNQWSQEPQSEVINVSNVKPSTITNQEWYQQSRNENVIYNNLEPQQPSPAPSSQQWSQPAYTENYTQDYSKTTSNSYQQSSVPSYAPKPSTWGSNNLGQIDTLPTINAPSNQYTFLSKDSTDNYQKSSQQYSSTYVPPPWETDAAYVPPVQNVPNQNYYQAPPQTSTFSPSRSPAWKPMPPPSKFSKPPPTSYQPPAPNQSFVKTIIEEQPNIPGRKTYYSEYERRYISVPESTYIPSETKYQPQPDPSPQYYYDNNEPTEKVEHTWRKELREFTEKSTVQTDYQTEGSNVQPPWEDEGKYGKTPTVTYTPTPTWSQTLRPRSWRERSFESELVNSQDWKSNTLGRGRPVSSYVNSNIESIPEKPRGVSVDRYNPNSYQAPLPAEHPPAQTYTLSPTPAPQAKVYNNPNVPAYHARASAEPRENPVNYIQPRTWGEPRTSPLQSRSFKYLQWITGTED